MQTPMQCRYPMIVRTHGAGVQGVFVDVAGVRAEADNLNDLRGAAQVQLTLAYNDYCANGIAFPLPRYSALLDVIEDAHDLPRTVGLLWIPLATSCGVAGKKHGGC